MGLDIFFYKLKRADYENNKNNKEKLTENELGYFRKVNFLVGFFDYEDNCSYKVIDKDELQALKECCESVLHKEDDPAEVLPTQEGFFFGSTDYDEYYYEDVEVVLAWVENVLAQLEDDEIVLMWCWW